jgi:hypothetical protein
MAVATENPSRIPASLVLPDVRSESEFGVKAEVGLRGRQVSF